MFSGVTADNMHQLLNLLKSNRFFQIALVLGALLFVLLLAFTTDDSSTPTSSNTPLPSTTRPELINLADEERRRALEYRRQIEGSLPIYLEGFPTSPGIETAINLYYLEDDPSEVVRFEIYGLSYLNADANRFTNPNAVAFEESFKQGLTLLRERGIDPDKLVFIYGDTQYVRDTASAWVEKLGLLK